MTTELDNLHTKVDQINARNEDLERTVMHAFRVIAGDIVHASQGSQPEFAHRYADTYDVAMATAHELPVVDFRGTVKAAQASRVRTYDEKTDFGNFRAPFVEGVDEKTNFEIIRESSELSM